MSKCQCGGSLSKRSKDAPISCIQCGTRFPSWRCAWCDHQVPALAFRGGERFAVELGVLFPGISIRTSTADSPVDGAITEGIVVSTPGIHAVAPRGFSAVVILEGNRFLVQPDLNSHERVLSQYFEAASRAQKNAPIILIQDNGHPIVSALMKWNPAPYMHQQLQEMRELNLPPYSLVVSLTLSTPEIVRVKSALLKAIGNSLPATCRIFGPVQFSDDLSRIAIFCDIADSAQLTSSLHEFLRKRSATKKELPTIEVAPYSLSLLQ